MNFLGGLFGRVSRGSHAAAVATLHDGLWLVKRMDITLDARFYFLKRYRRHLAFVYSDFQRFSVSTEERIGLPPSEIARPR